MGLTPGTKLGPYEVLSPIGSGGMGEVYKARDTRLERDVAIKVLPETFAQDAERLRRFEQEARVISGLNHPNILNIYDVGRNGEAPFLVAELLEGETLGQRLQSGPLPQRKAVETASQVARGLAAAHDKGIVHRDLKPDNIFLTQDGRVKILDFGLAKNVRPEAFSASASMATVDVPVVASTPTAEGQVLGTVGYMSPEQVRGKAADHRSDIFSFGAILYEMLSGKRAFKKDSGVETMSAILNEDPPELTETNRNLSPGLERIVRHCLEKTPAQRFQSASDIAFDLETLSSHSTTALGTAALKGPRFSQKLALPIAATLMVVAAAAGFLAGRAGQQRMDVRFQQLTFQRGALTAGRFAADGQTILYSARNSSDSQQTVWTTRSDVLQGRYLDIRGARVASVSATGEMALLLNLGTSGSGAAGTLATLPISGGAPRELIKNVRSADYTPDGKSFVVALEGQNESTLEYPPGKVLYRYPGDLSDVRFSPDGSKIAFAEHPVAGDTRGMVALIDADGKNQKVLTAEYADITGLAWRGGNHIWFGGSDSGISASLYEVSLAGAVRSIERTPGSLYLFDINKNGEVLVAHYARRFETFAQVPGSTSHMDLSVFDYSIPAAISQDGRQVVLTEEGEGGGPRYSIFLRKTDGTPPVRLGEGIASDISPDGKWVVGGTITVPSPVILFPTGAGETKTYTNSGMDHQAMLFFRDGKRLFLTAREKGKGMRNWIMNADGSGLRPVTAENEVGILSQDESYVAVTREGSVYAKEIESGAEKRMITADPLPGLTFVGWSDEKGKAYFSSTEKLALLIWKVDVEKMTKTLLYRVDPTNSQSAVPNPAMKITRDGKYFVYAADRRNSDLYLLKGAQ